MPAKTSRLEKWREAQVLAVERGTLAVDRLHNTHVAAIDRLYEEFRSAGHLRRIRSVPKPIVAVPVAATSIKTLPTPVVPVPAPNIAPLLNQYHTDTKELVEKYAASSTARIDARIREASADLLQKVDERLAIHQQNILDSVQLAFGKVMQFFDPTQKINVTEILPALPERQSIVLPAGVVGGTVRRPLILLVNANAAQVASVQAAFPSMEIRSVDGRVPGETDPFLVVGFARFMSHPLSEACKKKFGDRFRVVSARGAASLAKQQIGAYINAGEHANRLNGHKQLNGHTNIGM